MNPINEVQDIWAYLRTTPLLWLMLTMMAYLLGFWCFERVKRSPIVSPVAIAASCLGVVLLITDTPYSVYFEGAQFVHFLLGPATVSLAIPLVANFPRVRRAAVPMLAALIASSATAIFAAILIAQVMGASDEAIRSLIPKSVTTPIAMGISEQIGGLPSLTAGLVVLTGILGAIIVTPLMNYLGFRDLRARGFAVGVTSHGIGTARAFQVHEVAGVFAAVAMALNGLVTAFVVALFSKLL